jgi:Ca2+-binding RTX toxin-like protein
MGEISFTADVDLDSLAFSFQNGAAVITYADNDQITVNTDAVFSIRDNVIGRYTLVSEADPGWIPVVRAQGYAGNLYGSFGDDHIVGGDNIETILPGYGDDIIEAGGGSDRIVLNDVYFYSSGGIGHKDVSGDGGNDIVETPLYQCLGFHYQLGDGHDTIEYDWSYSGIHPYTFAVDPVLNTVGFTPYGQDTLAFGDGITLADLRFVRAGDALDVSLLDGSGSIRLPGYFLAWDAKPPTEPPLPPEEGQGPDSLLDPLLVGLLPRSPLATIGFADGSVYDMATVLDSFLEVSTATLLGTGAADTLYGTQADDVIHARGGDDYIEDFGGSNTIDAGAGDDWIDVGSDNLIEPGPGNDYINITAGDNFIRFGPGSGRDSVELDVDAGTVVIDMLGGLTPADITVTMENNQWGQSPLITVNATGDTLAAMGLRYDPVQGEWNADPDGAAIEVRFADGTVIAGSELVAMAQGAAGELIEGTRGRDLLIGTEGDDTLMGYRDRDTIIGAAGNDLIIGGRGRDIVSGGLGDDSYVYAAGDGRDVINNDDADLQGTDILRLDDVDYDQVWLSRNRKHLLLNIAGSDDRVRVNGWFVNEEDQLDAIYAGDRVLMRDQVDQLVNAMAAFDVPSGVGTIISNEARVALEPTLASVWQLSG